MAIGTDFEVQADGDIRHVANTTVFTLLELHEWLQNLSDDATATGDDNVSILTANPSRLDGPRSDAKPMYLNLLAPFNIDDTAAQFLKFGSVTQAGGDVVYTGLKTIGTPLVAASPMYIVQNGAKITDFWADGHLQILVKEKTGGVEIDSGIVRVYSRKFRQTYSDFEVDLSAAGEQVAAISTSLTDWTTLSEVNALALSTKVAITPGDSNHDSGDGNGSKAYKGVITLSGGITVAEAAQYLQAICREASTTTINSVAGWQYRMLEAGYVPNSAAPFGVVAGGKWFVAQGWWIAGSIASDALKYQMISHDGTTITNPAVVAITISGIIADARVLCGRDDGAGGFIDDEYTLDGIHHTDHTTVVVHEAISADTPASGFLRIGGVPFTYDSWATKTFTLPGALGQEFADETEAWVPFIDAAAAGTSLASANFNYDSDFTARVKVRKGASPDSRKPFESTLAVTVAGGSTTAILDVDE